MSQYDIPSLYEFLVHTPEKGLRNMLIDNKNITNVHFNLLLKVAKNCPVDKFAECFEKNEFPKIKMNKDEEKIRETFWKSCTTVLLERGLLQKAPSAAA